MSENRPTAGSVEERTAAVEVADKMIRGLIPFGVESRDMGGWNEIISATALRSAKLDELIARVDHAGVPIGRFPKTLTVEERSDGLHWAVTPPESRADLLEAIERGDLRAGSWQMVVSKDRWDGDTRHVEQIAELRDVSVVSSPAYPAAAVEYRTAPTNEESTMSESTTSEERTEEARTEDSTETDKPEERTESAKPEERTESTGTLRVEDRVQRRPRGLAAAFESRGWPAERAELAWGEYEAEVRALTVSAATDDVSQAVGTATPLGVDLRYAWPAFRREAVGRDTTSITVLRQTSRSLASATSVIRAIDAVSAKPETSSTIDDVVTPLKQVASIQSNVPNVYLESSGIRSVIEQDLRHAIDGGLDKLVLDAIASSGFVAPGSNLLTSIRSAITTIQGNGYQPDTLILTPAAAESIDTMVSGISGGTADFVFSPGQFAPGTLFGLQRRISKSVPAPVVADAAALGKMYMSPVSLERFEADAGTTNRSNVRLELHAAFGVERTEAAVRIAAS